MMNVLVKRFGIILSFLFLSLNCFSEDVNMLFTKANELYRKGDFAGAGETYEKILKTGIVSSEVYFDLGNAYFKQKKTAPSILNFERALKLSPRDEDIAFNLALANLQAVDKIIPVPRLFYRRWLSAFTGSLSSSEWSFIAIAASWITLLAAVCFVLSLSPAAKKFFLYEIGI